jgi:hypothetical protein
MVFRIDNSHMGRIKHWLHPSVGAQSLTGGHYVVSSKFSNSSLQKYKGLEKFEWGPMPPLSSSWVRP